MEVLDGRDGADLAAWLRRHPEVAVVCRDRSGGYGEGARAGAPQAVQVADRFHLWQNLGQAVEKTVSAHRFRLGEPPPKPPGEAAPRVVQPEAELKIVTRMRWHYTAVQDLHAQGLPKTVIGRKLGLHPATVRKFATASSLEDLIAKTERRAHLVDPYTGHLHRRWREGERNATQLFREIQMLGYPGGELAVQRYLRRFRHGRGHAPRLGPKPPTVRQVTSGSRWNHHSYQAVSADQRPGVIAVARDPAPAVATGDDTVDSALHTLHRRQLSIARDLRVAAWAGTARPGHRAGDEAVKRRRSWCDKWASGRLPPPRAERRERPAPPPSMAGSITAQ